MKIILIIGIWLAASLSVSATEQVCEGKSVRKSAEFKSLGDGAQVLDTKTGLIWQRCIEGSNWNGKTCQSEISILPGRRISYSDANRRAIAKSTKTVVWRIPTKAELITIREPSCYNPSIDLQVFPASPKWTSDGSFWSSSPEASGVTVVSAIGGSDAWETTEDRSENHTRLVRTPKKGRSNLVD